MVKLVAYDTYLRRRIDQGMPAFGTCTGMILLAKEIIGSDQPRIGVMDISVQRNSFGRQIDSCETEIVIPALSHPRHSYQPYNRNGSEFCESNFGES
ncbi:MAG TPA: hypothetical protein DHD79_10315 [Firmicutes bacterium]|nr:hypothetical protein [Bacillota bacterium]HCF91350.1 hypothetical protein [Bacillota bacterium]HCT36683.1 hypothetical protein [Bacillota bacterium]HCX71617.1 hypothetical protein [Bacillota bacterium]